MILSPFVQETSFHGPEPIALVVPNPSAPLFAAQTIEEKLSARNGTSATNGVFSVSLIVSASTTVALSIGPPLALVALDLVLDVVGIERRAVMTFDAIVQLECVFGPGGVDAPRLCQVRHRPPVLVGCEQRVIDEAPDLERECARRSMRIERVDIAVTRPDDVFCFGGAADAKQYDRCGDRFRPTPSCELHRKSPSCFEPRARPGKSNSMSAGALRPRLGNTGIPV